MNDGYEIRSLNIAESEKLNEYIIIRDCLKDCLDQVALWISMHAAPTPLEKKELLIANSLFRDALNMFVECFDRNGRPSLSSKDVFDSVDGGAVAFKYLRDIRNSYSAHSYGPLRQACLGIPVNSSGEMVAEYKGFVMNYAGLDFDKRPEFYNMIQIALNHSRSIIKGLDAHCIKYALSMTNEERKNLPKSRAHVATGAEINMGRPSFRKAKDAS